MGGGSQQLRQYRIARRDGATTEDTASMAGITTGEARLIDADDAKYPPGPEAYVILNASPSPEAANDQDRPQLWLDVPKGQTFDEWRAMGEKLHRTERVLNWWIGDWWAAGEHRYGERAKAAAEGIFGVGYQALKDMAMVARAFEPSRRRDLLTFTHHRETAALPPEEADALLSKAESESLPTRQLRIEAMKRKVALGLFAPREDDDPEHTFQVDVARRWNRAPVAYRESIFELIQEAAQNGFGEIDP